MIRASETVSPVCVCVCVHLCMYVRAHVCVCKVELQCCSGDGFCSSREPDKTKVKEHKGIWCFRLLSMIV